MAHFCVKTCALHSPYAQYGSFAMLGFSLNCTHVSESFGLGGKVD
jgi:hypothetical protein